MYSVPQARTPVAQNLQLIALRTLSALQTVSTLCPRLLRLQIYAPSQLLPTSPCSLVAVFGCSCGNVDSKKWCLKRLRWCACHQRQQTDSASQGCRHTLISVKSIVLLCCSLMDGMGLKACDSVYSSILVPAGLCLEYPVPKWGHSRKSLIPT